MKDFLLNQKNYCFKYTKFLNFKKRFALLSIPKRNFNNKIFETTEDVLSNYSLKFIHNIVFILF